MRVIARLLDLNGDRGDLVVALVDGRLELARLDAAGERIAALWLSRDELGALPDLLVMAPFALLPKEQTNTDLEDEHGTDDLVCAILHHRLA